MNARITGLQPAAFPTWLSHHEITGSRTRTDGLAVPNRALSELSDARTNRVFLNMMEPTVGLEPTMKIRLQCGCLRRSATSAKSEHATGIEPVSPRYE